ncbi:hypothetical protein PsorP6_013484 [Peronosclerospora sorghi]|uniref:Uncharacterized protein n=1 Tax=Peronosclerospora sorghi TaxID=230839 RepID=A0ACC0VIA3_9STRA|nr:hypothetical protein PsorP6_013484 [Peronosclerospora sorghi]
MTIVQHGETKNYYEAAKDQQKSGQERLLHLCLCDLPKEYRAGENHHLFPRQTPFLLTLGPPPKRAGS